MAGHEFDMLDLGISAMFPNTSRVALYSRCLVGPSGVLYLITSGYSSRNVPYADYVSPSFVIVLIVIWLVSACDQSSGCLTVRIDSNHRVHAAVQVLTKKSGVCLSSVWCQLTSPFAYSTCEANWVLV